MITVELSTERDGRERDKGEDVKKGPIPRFQRRLLWNKKERVTRIGGEEELDRKEQKSAKRIGNWSENRLLLL